MTKPLITNVYLLLFQSRPFYVGLSIHPVLRFRRHCQEAFTQMNEVTTYKLMRELIDIFPDGEFTYHIIYEDVPVEEAIAIEKDIIAQNPQFGNESPGGGYHGGIRGEEIGNSRYTEDIVLTLRDYCELHPGYTILRILDDLDLPMSESWAASILRHDSWKHVGGYKRLDEWERANKIREMKNSGWSNPELSEYWSMTTKSIRRILRGERGMKHRWENRKM